jgi:hypothetical protein
MASNDDTNSGFSIKQQVDNPACPQRVDAVLWAAEYDLSHTVFRGIGQ